MGLLDSVLGGTPDRSGLSAATKALLLVLAAKAAKDYMAHRQQTPQGSAAPTDTGGAGGGAGGGLGGILGSIMGGGQGSSAPGGGGGLGGLGGMLGSVLGGGQGSSAPAGGGGGGLGGMLGSVLGGGQGGAAGGLGSILGGAGGAGGGGLGGLLGGLGGAGVLGSLVDQFGKSGHGDAMASWIGPGANQPIAPAQLAQALGPGPLKELEATTGMPQQSLLEQLSHELPAAMDHITPHGRLPTEDELTPTA